MESKPTKIVLEDGTEVTIEWDAQLGRLAEGYARAGDHSKGRIRIAKGNLERANRTLLLHEVLHELWEKADIGRFVSRKTEELVLDSLSSWIVDTMRRNPQLRDYIFGGDISGD